MNPPSPAGTRIAALDGLRGLGALLVMLFHFDVFYLPQAGLSRAFPGLTHGYLGVDLFFLLSGFVMAHVYGVEMGANWRAHWFEFARARVARIYPMFLLATLAMVVAYAVCRRPLNMVAFTGTTLVLQPALLQYLHGGLSWNYPTWSIGTEAAAYLYFVLYADMLMYGKRPSWLAWAWAGVVCAIAVRHTGSLNLFAGPLALLRTLAEFTLGALLYRAHRDQAPSARTWPLALAGVAAALAAWTRWDPFSVLAFACAIYHAVGGSGLLARALNSRAAVALGVWSYAVYLLHAPVHYTVDAVMAATGHPLRELSVSQARVAMGLTVLAVIALAALAHRWIEVPMRRWVLRALPAPDRRVVTRTVG